MQSVTSRHWILAAALAAFGLAIAAQSASASWTVLSTKGPSGAQESVLYGISCANGEVCMSVGSYVSKAGVQEPLAVNFTIAELPPAPKGKAPALYNVSCPPPLGKFCMAVGRYIDSGGNPQALAEEYNAGVWKLQSLPLPPESTAAELGTVSCPTTTECTAVGDYHDSTGEHFLAEQWNSGAWKAEGLAAPAGAGFPGLIAVSCPESKACVSAGTYRNKASEQFIVGDEWTGTWSLQTMTNPAGSNRNIISDSCPASKKCVAVGYYTNGGGTVEPLAQELSGGTWSAVTLPSLTGTSNELYGVSCATSAKECTAVGKSVKSGVTENLAEESKLGVWSSVTIAPPSGAKSSFLQRPSCVTGEPCSVVGQYVNKAGETVMLIERKE
jgi:hypothetical protein